MAYIGLAALPGVCKVDSAYFNSIKQAYISGRGATGRFTDMNRMRFIAGLPEKVGGRVKLSSTQLAGIPRGLRDWRDNNQFVYLGVGTNTNLYYYGQSNGIYTDITPYRAIVTGSLSSPFTTSSGSATVSVALTAHGLSIGDYVQFTAATNPLNGIIVNGTFFVAAVTDANNFTFIANGLATSSGSGGGATTYNLYRITLTNPFTTVSGSPTVTVAHTSNGALQGDTVFITGGSAVGGLTLTGKYIIQSVSANSYTITAASNATSSVSNGGGTPSFQYEINVGTSSAAFSFGYGTGGYGQDAGGGYGTLGNLGLLFNPRVWTLDHYGQQLLGAPTNGQIYIWDPSIGGQAYPLYGSPVNVLACFVTPERFVFALGSSVNSMQVSWPDQQDYTNWIPGPTNTSNFRTLQGGNFLVGGIAVRDGASLVFSNTTAFLFTYTGDSSVYASTAVGQSTGLVGPLAVVVIGGIAYWMGYNEFWNWNGGVGPLPSDDIRDYVFTNMAVQQVAKNWAGSNIAKKEAWFGYCSSTATEIDSYAIYHIDQGCFSIGKWTMTCWIDHTLFSNPIAGDQNSYVYYQEDGLDDDGVAQDAYAVFSPMDISKGQKGIDVFGFIPDFERQTGNVLLTVNTQKYPQDTPTANGPYTIAADDSTPQIDLRLAAKMVGFKVESNVLGGDFRMGLCRVQGQPSGDRR